ncbi:MAG: hypothetical protein E7429_03480 [Ruminococcaceae bacterium]|nr:hypothetical protein [Oscillospiraceae bacterium]
MELRDAVLSRRSVRKYKDTPVPREILEEILETACWAPSADNRQPWYFVALTGKEDIETLRGTMERVSEEIAPHLEEMFPRHPNVVRRCGCSSAVWATRRSMCWPSCKRRRATGKVCWKAWRRPSRTCFWRPAKRGWEPAGSTPPRDLATGLSCATCLHPARTNSSA